ncbi:MAG: hypothetical protein AAFY15_06510, partial [Cyanobacteria bacterium J06648_11]
MKIDGWARLMAVLGLTFSAVAAAGELPSGRSQAQLLTVPGLEDRLGQFCHQSPTEIDRKNQLRLAASRSDEAWGAYTQIVADHRLALENCRQRTFPRTQAVWLRLHPCDTDPSVLADVMDRIVNLGYNRVYIEV